MHRAWSMHGGIATKKVTLYSVFDACGILQTVLQSFHGRRVRSREPKNGHRAAATDPRSPDGNGRLTPSSRDYTWRPVLPAARTSQTTPYPEPPTLVVPKMLPCASNLAEQPERWPSRWSDYAHQFTRDTDPAFIQRCLRIVQHVRAKIEWRSALLLQRLDQADSIFRLIEEDAMVESDANSKELRG